MRWIKNLFARPTLTVEQELELQRQQVAGLLAHTDRQIACSMEMRSR